MSMSKTTIEIGLNVASINKAIQDLEKHRQDVMQKSELFRRRVAELISDYSASGFNGAIVDDITPKSGGARVANVSMSVEDGDKVSVVIASGEDAVWVEFGAGVYHNGAAGSSPNPYGQELGFTIGGYGTNGTKKTWGFYEGDQLIITHGTPATMPMYNAVQRVVRDIDTIAREVFG
jgi:hypothetical protein